MIDADIIGIFLIDITIKESYNSIINTKKSLAFWAIDIFFRRCPIRNALMKWAKCMIGSVIVNIISVYTTRLFIIKKIVIINDTACNYIDYLVTDCQNIFKHMD